MNLLADLGTQAVSIAMVGFIVEALVEIIKQATPKKIADEVKFFLSVILGVALCVALQISLFTPDKPMAYYLGMVICGIVASRGANYVHNFVGNLKK